MVNKQISDIAVTATSILPGDRLPLDSGGGNITKKFLGSTLFSSTNGALFDNTLITSPIGSALVAIEDAGVIKTITATNFLSGVTITPGTLPVISLPIQAADLVLTGDNSAGNALTTATIAQTSTYTNTVLFDGPNIIYAAGTELIAIETTGGVLQNVKISDLANTVSINTVNTPIVSPVLSGDRIVLGRAGLPQTAVASDVADYVTDTQMGAIISVPIFTSIVPYRDTAGGTDKVSTIGTILPVTEFPLLGLPAQQVDLVYGSDTSAGNVNSKIPLSYITSNTVSNWIVGTPLLTTITDATQVLINAVTGTPAGSYATILDVSKGLSISTLSAVISLSLTDQIIVNTGSPNSNKSATIQNIVDLAPGFSIKAQTAATLPIQGADQIAIADSSAANANAKALVSDVANYVAQFGVAPVSTQTANYTLVAADAGTEILVDSASPVTITIPANGTVPFAVGTNITIRRINTGTVTLAILTDTLRAAGLPGPTYQVDLQYRAVNIDKIATTTWCIDGPVV